MNCEPTVDYRLNVPYNVYPYERSCSPQSLTTGARVDAFSSAFSAYDLGSSRFPPTPYIGCRKYTPKKPSLHQGAMRGRERAMEAPTLIQQHSLKKISGGKKSAVNKSTPLSNPKSPTSSRVEPQNMKRVKAGDDSPSELAVKLSLYRDRQAAESLSSDKPPLAGDSLESNTRKDALQERLPYPAHQQTSINSLSHTVLLVAGPPENDCLVAAKKPANSTQSAEKQRQSHNVLTHAVLFGDGFASTGNGVQATADKPANAPPYMYQMPPDKVFLLDNVLNEVEMELIWLEEESMYCLVRTEFNFDFIYEYASPALKVELRKLSGDNQSETGMLNQIVRMDDWRVSRHFDFTRKDIRMNYF
jgi:hypothetical protein